MLYNNRFPTGISFYLCMIIDDWFRCRCHGNVKAEINHCCWWQLEWPFELCDISSHMMVTSPAHTFPHVLFRCHLSLQCFLTTPKPTVPHTLSPTVYATVKPQIDLIPGLYTRMKWRAWVQLESNWNPAGFYPEFQYFRWNKAGHRQSASCPGEIHHHSFVQVE